MLARMEDELRLSRTLSLTFMKNDHHLDDSQTSALLQNNNISCNFLVGLSDLRGSWNCMVTLSRNPGVIYDSIYLQSNTCPWYS